MGERSPTGETKPMSRKCYFLLLDSHSVAANEQGFM
jgi:hypothetical protein